MSRVQPVVKILRYSDPNRTMLAKNAAIFLGKPDEDNLRRPLNLLKKKHKSIFRGESVDFEFTASKVVYDHLTTYTTHQQRACAGLRANKAGSFVVPLETVGTVLEDVIEHVGEQHRDRYLKLIDGIDPDTNDPMQKARLQAARSVAPISVNLHFTLQFNFLTLMEAIFVQRMWAPGAQADTKEVVQMMWNAVRAYDPDLWDAAYEVFGSEAIGWESVRPVIKKSSLTVADLLADLKSKQQAGVIDPDMSIVAALIEMYAPKGSMWS